MYIVVTCTTTTAAVHASFYRITKCIAIDCEMVGGGARKKDQYDMLARCSIVNSNGQTVYNKYVAPMDNVADYRTTVSGVTPKDLKEGTPNSLFYFLFQVY